MNRWLLIAAVLVCAGKVDSKFMVAYPNSVIRGQALTAVVTLQDNDPSSVTLTLSLTSTTDPKNKAASISVPINNGETKEVPIAIPMGAPTGTYHVLVATQTSGSELTVSAPPDEDRSAQTVTVRAEAISIFVQTDKAKYKPGQKVQFRVVAVDVDLKPKLGDMEISIHDAKNNKVKQWLNVTNDKGVVSKSLQLSNEPLLGEWTIKVKIDGVESEKKFTVEKYVLPKFEVKVNMKSYVLEDENLVVTVSAKYTFGKTVIGELTLKVSQGGSRALEWQKEKIEGEKTVVIPMRSIKGHLGANLRTLTVKADVVETVTGNVLTGSGEISVEPFDVKLEFTKASDDYFKPGLQYRAVVLATQPNGEPLMSLEDLRRHTVKLIVQLNKMRGEPITRTTDPQPVPGNGIISFDISVPKDTISIRLEAVYAPLPAIKTSKYVNNFRTEMKQNIQLLPLLGQDKFKVGENAKFTVRATPLVKSYVVMVKSRGKIVHSSQERVSPSGDGETSSVFSFPVTTSMSPSANVIVYALVKNSTGQVEMIADSYPFELSELFENKVSIDFSVKKAELGTEVKVLLSAAPDSYIGVLAVDQSVKLLATGNDISKDDVISELGKYDSNNQGGGGRPCGFRGCMVERKKRSIAPWYWNPSGTSGDVMKNAGMGFQTNALYSKTYEIYVMEDRVAFAMPIDVAAERGIMYKNAGAPPEPVKVRKMFPETWIWQDATAGADGKAELSAVVPDTITSWVASAFALSTRAGLGLAPSEAKLQAFKPFFVSMNLPYSVIQSEEFILNVVVFNYLGRDAQVTVKLLESTEFKVKHGDANIVDERSESKDAVETVMVKSGIARAVNFWVVTEKIGNIKLEIRADAGIARDAVERILIVEPKGKRVSGSAGFLVQLTGGEMTYEVDVDIPDQNLVQGSERVEVKVIGDILGPSLENLDKLLQMPYGCGEQNMINFAPGIFIARYLKVTNQLTNTILDKIVKIQESGYQRELNYKRNDGSFSAFGQSDDSGSTWLTAFVYKCFSQAEHVTVDDTILSVMKIWLMKQNKGGKFNEPGRVIHVDMQGGSAKGIAMTAYVVIAMLEGAKPNDRKQIAADIGLASTIAQIEREVTDTNDPYVIAICIYALKLADSSVAETQLTRLREMAKNDETLKKIMIDGFCLAKKPDVSGRLRCVPVEPKSRDVEMAAYILLTLTLKNDIQEGSKVAKCLMGQRNAYGGFASTQDTVLAVQALAGFAALISGDKRQLSVNIDTGDETKSATVNNVNAAVLQTIPLKPSTRKVDFVINGQGTALVQVAYWYNVDNVVKPAPIDLTTTTKSVDDNTFEIMACTRWTNSSSESGMGLIKIQLPSGFAHKKISGTMKRYDLDEKAVNVYVDQFTPDEKCIRVMAERRMSVTNLQPVAVQASPYYKPEEQKVSFYSASQVAVQTECQMCPECRGCPGYGNSAHRLLDQSPIVLLVVCLVALLLQPIRG